MFFAAMGVTAMLNLAGGNWIIVNDGVMGGRSSSSTDVHEQGMTFSGELSLENNGGFASTRRQLENPPLGATGVRLQVRGDGRSYQLRLRHDQRFDGVAWRHDFDTNGQWQELKFQFKDFIPVFRGYRVGNAGPVVVEDLGQVGFMLADKQPGSFKLQVKEIRFTGQP
jgi:monofunctional biosynthetic peptidoglycan transglycosylase